MKNEKFLVKNIFAIAVLLLVSFSCQDEAIKELKNPDENKSQITLIEEKFGVTLAKEDITITDATGQNKITIRVAALDKDRLDEYINSRRFTITPIYNRTENKPLKLAPTLTEPAESTFNDKKESLNEMILTEMVSQELKEGVKGIGFRNEYNSEYTPANGRVKYINNNVRYYSPKWPEVLSVQAYNQVTFRIQRQTRWYSGWSTIFGFETWCCYNYSDFDIDGPWYVRLEISFDYQSDFYFEWFNW
jgi:hypothetical protein